MHVVLGRDVRDHFEPFIAPGAKSGHHGKRQARPPAHMRASSGCCFCQKWASALKRLAVFQDPVGIQLCQSNQRRFLPIEARRSERRGTDTLLLKTSSKRRRAGSPTATSSPTARSGSEAEPRFSIRRSIMRCRKLLPPGTAPPRVRGPTDPDRGTDRARTRPRISRIELLMARRALKQDEARHGTGSRRSTVLDSFQQHSLPGNAETTLFQFLSGSRRLLTKVTRGGQNNKQTVLFFERVDESRHATASV